jgi:Rps23 Pro-64 3,4-dihydroxylase Tpa1-like proline 4-hydroxylase
MKSDDLLDILKLFDNERYAQIAYDNHKNYINNNPFPHIYIDNFLPNDIAIILSRAYPKLKESESSFKLHSNKNVQRHFLEDVRKFSDPLRVFANAISSRSFLLFLEVLSGIKAIIPDPYFLGGGAMITGRGGFLNVHADFNWNQKLQLWRKINVLFYLTEDWQEDWKGNLELWSINKIHKEKAIAPFFNRVVIFTTTSNSFHGQPEPLECPLENPRKVFSAFYYGMYPNEMTDHTAHFTKYDINDPEVQAKKDDSPYSQKIIDDYLSSCKK